MNSFHKHDFQVTRKRCYLSALYHDVHIVEPAAATESYSKVDVKLIYIAHCMQRKDRVVL